MEGTGTAIVVLGCVAAILILLKRLTNAVARVVGLLPPLLEEALIRVATRLEAGERIAAGEDFRPLGQCPHKTNCGIAGCCLYQCFDDDWP